MWIWTANKCEKFHAKRLNWSENILKCFRGSLAQYKFYLYFFVFVWTYTGLRRVLACWKSVERHCRRHTGTCRRHIDSRSISLTSHRVLSALTTTATSSVAAEFGRHGMPPPASNPDLWPFELQTGESSFQIWVRWAIGFSNYYVLCMRRTDRQTDRKTDRRTDKSNAYCPFLTVRVLGVRQAAVGWHI